MTELSDELLVAYVDGDLARAQSAAVEKVLEQDDVLAARVDALKEAHARLEQAFDAILSGAAGDIMAQVPVLPRMPAKRQGRPLTTVGLAIACVGVVLAALVAGFGWPLISADRGEGKNMAASTAIAESWQERAIAGQSLLSRASVEVSPESQANEDLVALQMAQALGAGAKIPDLKAEGFKFTRGQLLSFRDRPLAQLLYLAAAKPPLALYAMRSAAGVAESAPVYREIGAIGSLSFNLDGVSYLLAGEEDAATLARLAKAIRGQLQTLGAKPPVASAADPLVTGSH